MNKTICLAGGNEEGAMDKPIRHLEEGPPKALNCIRSMSMSSDWICRRRSSRITSKKI